MTDKDKTKELVRTAFSTFRENAPLDMSPSEYIADYLIAHGVTVTDNNVGCKWRPASEPPKENGAYLVSLTSFTGKHTWQDVCKFANNLEKVDNFDFKGIKRAGWYSYKDGDYYEVDDITHWMPLPKLPKEVE